MLDEFSTPRKFWAEAISTACYVSNHVFVRSKLGKTPYELRFEHRRTVSHFRVFGCKCFVLKSGNLDKFEARSTDAIFLGYSAHSRGYRVLVLKTNKIIETCEVTFDEASPGISPSIAGTNTYVQGENIFVDEEEEEEEENVTPTIPPVASAMPSSTIILDGPQITSSMQPESDQEGASDFTAP